MRYARDVVAGKQSACELTRLACQRNIDDLARWKDDGPWVFDKKAAERVIEIIERFPHIRGVWARAQNRLLLQPWQKFILAVTFGWKSREYGNRRFRTVYIEVPRKNAKSTLTSAVGLYLLACDDEPGAHVVSAAATRDQAKIIFVDAQHMARREHGFQKRFGVRVLAHVIAQEESGSKFEAISAEDSNLDGLNIHAALIDELHAHKTRGVWDVLETATGARSQPLLWAITTAGVNRASVCYDQRSHIVDILRGTVADETYFGIIYGIDDGDDYFAEPTWIKANPNWGVSIYPEAIRSEAARAMSMPSAQTAFLTRHLNVWVNADHSWLDIRAWTKCADTGLTPESFAGEPCFVGIDLAIRSDIAAVVMLFPPNGERDWWAVFGRFYLPEEQIEKTENTHYQGWERAGRLIMTPGAVTDFEYILDDVVDYVTRFDVREVCCDPWKNLPLNAALQNRGVTVPLVEVRQSLQIFSPAMKEMEALVVSAKLRHDGDPLFTWMVSNVVCHRDSRDNIYPRKEAPERKIDGVTALLMCIDRAVRNSGQQNSGEIWVI